MVKGMTKEDIAEMRTAAAAASPFPRIEIDPAHVIELCDLAVECLERRRIDLEELYDF